MKNVSGSWAREVLWEGKLNAEARLHLHENFALQMKVSRFVAALGGTCKAPYRENWERLERELPEHSIRTREKRRREVLINVIGV